MLCWSPGQAQLEVPWCSLGEAVTGPPEFGGKSGSKQGCVEVLENTETMKTSGNRCKRYRVSANICYLIVET